MYYILFMKLKIIDDMALFLDNNLSENQLSKVQDFILSGAIFIGASKFLSMLIILIITLELVFATISILLNLPMSVLILPLFILPGIFTYVLIMQERRASEIEKVAPDFLRQLSTMLKVGLSFENAMEDMSKYGQGPLYDEVKRTIIEIRMGRNIDDAWIAMSKRLKSRDLERIFLIILDGRKSGSSMANVINNVSDDLRDLLALKRERKATVMMSVMFLFISAVIATPFALAMVSIYSGFMQNFGESSQLILVTPIVGQIYLIIHSILVSFIISIIMYGKAKKGVKFTIPILFIAYIIFYAVSNFGGSFLM